MPKISVVMPTYNEADYLPEAIESILSQSYRDYEFVIVNDGSTDNSRQIIDRYAAQDQRIMPLHLNENVGLVGALNEGIRAAKGEWIARMDGDDISYADRFQFQMRYLESHHEVDVLSTGIRGIDQDGTTLYTKTLPESHNLLVWEIPFALAAFHGTVCMRKEKLIQVGMYSDRLVLEDVELWTRMVKVARFASIPEILYGYRRSRQEYADKVMERRQISNRIYREFIGLQVGRGITEREYDILRLAYYPDKKVKLTNGKAIGAIDTLLTLFDVYQKNDYFDAHDLSDVENNLRVKIENILQHVHSTEMLKRDEVGKAYWLHGDFPRPVRYLGYFLFHFGEAWPLVRARIKKMMGK